MSDWFLAVVSIFPLELFTTRALNLGALDNRFRRILWAIERFCLVLVLSGFVLVQFWLVQVAMTAAVAVYLLRAVVRGLDFGLVGFAKMVGSGFVIFGRVIASLLMAFIEAVPETLGESMESESEPESTMRFSLGSRGGYNYSTGSYDYEPGIRYTSDD